MPTIKDVSRRAGVSSATVSHVINGTRYVSQQTREQVRSAIEELDYHPNYMARSLRSGKSDTIGVIVPSTRNPYFTELAWMIEQCARENNNSVIICNTENTAEKERFYIDVLINKQVDGIVFITCGNYDVSAQALAQSGIPFVAVDRDFNGEKCGCCAFAMTDEQLGGRLAAEHLIELGHRRIGCITGGSDEQVASAKRRRGFFDELKRQGAQPDEGLVLAGDFGMQSGFERGMELLKMPDPPTAIFAFNDLMAFGVMRAANECGIAVPEELSVMGFDDIEMAAYTIPPLTTVGQNKPEIAQRIVDMLAELMSGESAAERSVVILPELRVRKTTAKIRL